MANEVKIVASIDVAKSQAQMQKQLNEISKSLNMTIKAQADMGKSVQNTSASVEKMSKDFKAAQVNASNLANAAPKIEKINAPLKEASKNAYSFGNMLGEGIKKMAVWSLAATAFYAPIRALQSNIKYTLELDNAMNQIRIVTYKTQDEINTLALSYNKLAKEMGTTTAEIANTSVELYRQGLATSEVEERMNSIIKYAKISSISLEKSNEIITATANATGEKVGKIVDIFALLGRQNCSAA